MPEILELKELTVKTYADEKALATAENLTYIRADNVEPQLASTLLTVTDVPVVAVPLLSSSWTMMRESVAIVPDTPELGSSTPPSPDRRSLWTSIREKADILSATCSPVLGCNAPGSPFQREPSNFISLVAALRRLNISDAHEDSKEISMVRHIPSRPDSCADDIPVQAVDEDAVMCELVTMPTGGWSRENERTHKMEVDELPRIPRHVHNVVDGDNDVIMIGTPIRAADKRITNVNKAGPKAKRPNQDVVMTDLTSRCDAGPKRKAATTGPVPVSHCYPQRY